MKKFSALIFFSLMIPFLLRANPIELIYFSEIYFEGDEWSLEFEFGYGLMGDDNLDNYRLICSSGTSQFKTGIDITNTHWLIITQDSLLSPFFINKYGDFIQLEYYYNGGWVPMNMPFCFGDYEDSWVHYPFEGQSIVNTTIYYADQFIEFWSVKENNPTLGSSFYQVTTYGTFAGRVLDQNLDPVEGIYIKYCDDWFIGLTLQPIYTDSDGYFYSQSDMPARNYEISLIWNDISLLDTTTTIEPDSMTWCNYYLDTVLLPEVITKEKESAISFGNFPNPFRDYSTFVVELPRDRHFKEGRISVYDMTGRVVYDREIAPEMTGTAPVFLPWDLASNRVEVFPGEYISCLVLDGVVVAKSKSSCVR
jgi:hypothetical protein